MSVVYHQSILSGIRTGPGSLLIVHGEIGGSQRVWGGEPGWKMAGLASRDSTGCVLVVEQTGPTSWTVEDANIERGCRKSKRPRRGQSSHFHYEAGASRQMLKLFLQPYCSRSSWVAGAQHIWITSSSVTPVFLGTDQTEKGMSRAQTGLLQLPG